MKPKRQDSQIRYNLIHASFSKHCQPSQHTHLDSITPRSWASADFRFLGEEFPTKVRGERAIPAYPSRLAGSFIGEAGSGRLWPTTRRNPVINPVRRH